MTSLNGHLPAPLDAGLDRMLDDACTDVLGLQPPVVGPSANPEEFFIGEIDVTENAHLGTSHSSNALMLEDLDANSLLAPEADAPELMLGTSAPAALQGWGGFPAIPEHAELQMTALQPGAFPRSASQPTFVPTATTGQHQGLGAYIPGTVPSAVDHSGAPALTSSPTASTTSSGGGAPFAAGVPRVASMPNLSLAGATGSMLHTAVLRRNAAAAAVGSGAGPGPSRAGMPRSRSANDVTGLNRYTVPHSEFLTPPHLRKGKGGRQPAGDPRMDPRIDPKKAKRILANRLSAAKSKLKQKSAAEGLRQRVEMLRLQREGLATEVTSLAEACAMKEAEREALLRQLHAAEEAIMNGKPQLPGLGGHGPFTGLMV